MSLIIAKKYPLYESPPTGVGRFLPLLFPPRLAELMYVDVLKLI